MGQTDLLPFRRKTWWGIFFLPEKSDGFGRVWTRELGYQMPAPKPHCWTKDSAPHSSLQVTTGCNKKSRWNVFEKLRFELVDDFIGDVLGGRNLASEQYSLVIGIMQGNSLFYEIRSGRRRGGHSRRRCDGVWVSKGQWQQSADPTSQFWQLVASVLGSHLGKRAGSKVEQQKICY